MVSFMVQGTKTYQHSGRPKGSGSGAAEPLKRDEIRRLFGVCIGSRGLRNRAFVALGLHAGMRVGTVKGLQVADVIGLDGKCKASICISGDREKSKRSHRYYLTPQGRQLVNDYISGLNVHELADDAPFFPGRNGGFMTQPSASRLVANLLEKAGIENQSSHALRKTFARGLLDAGVAVPAISEALNHSSIQTTVRYLGDHKAEVRNAVENLSF